MPFTVVFRRSKLSVFGLVLSSAMLLVFQLSVLANESVTLAWLPSISTDVAGYKIYYGTASQTYTSMIAVGKVTNLTIPNLIGGQVYYFVVKSYDLFGFTSQLSSEQSIMPPTTGFSLTFTGQ